MNMYIWLCKDTGTINRPLRLAVCSLDILCVNVDILRCVSWSVLWVFVAHSRNVRNIFIICMLHNHHSKVWFLHYKSMVFGVQKGGFYIAKVWFLKFESMVLVFVMQ